MLWDAFRLAPRSPFFWEGCHSHRVSRTHVCCLHKLSGLGIQEELPVIPVSSRLKLPFSYDNLSATWVQDFGNTSHPWCWNEWWSGAWLDGQMADGCILLQMRSEEGKESDGWDLRFYGRDMSCCALHWQHVSFECEEIPWWQLEAGARVVWDLWDHLLMPHAACLNSESEANSANSNSPSAGGSRSVDGSSNAFSGWAGLPTTRGKLSLSFHMSFLFVEKNHHFIAMRMGKVKKLGYALLDSRRDTCDFRNLQPRAGYSNENCHNDTPGHAEGTSSIWAGRRPRATSLARRTISNISIWFHIDMSFFDCFFSSWFFFKIQLGGALSLRLGWWKIPHSDQGLGGAHCSVWAIFINVAGEEIQVQTPRRYQINEKLAGLASTSAICYGFWIVSLVLSVFCCAG